jgi:copper chaperone CopZ
VEVEVERTTLVSPSISCEHCIAAIKRAVERLEGVSSVEGDAASKTVTVSYDPSRVALPAIEKIMADEGYPAAK